MPNCVICNSKIEPSWYHPQSFCENCRENNKEKLEFISNPEQFKKEFNALFYMDVGDFNALFPQEVEFFNNRWEMSNLMTLRSNCK